MSSRAIIQAVRVAAVGLVVFGLAACGGEAAGDADQESGASESSAAAEASAGSSCVADYAESPCALLTAELARQEFPDVPAGLEPEVMGSVCELTWEGDRTREMEVGAGTMEIPVSNQLSLGWIDTYQERPAEQFRRAYLPTREEVERGAEMMQEEYEKQAEEQGLSASQKEMGQEVGESVASASRFEAVDAVGDQASWSANFNTLYVLRGHTNFQVSAKVSGSEEENRQAAIRLAEAVMEDCR